MPMQAGGIGSRWAQPTELGDALLALRDGGWTVLAGGTDFYAARVGRAIDDALLDITAIRTLRGITPDRLDGAAALRIGALTTWSELSRATLSPGLAALRLAAREVGGLQIQNRGTIGGNLCNASPAADGVPALLALDAQVELASLSGPRRLALAEYVLGNRRTARRADELLTAVLVPEPAERTRSLFLKLGHRRYLVISIAMVGLSVQADADGRIARCAVAVGACSAAAQRLPALEARLVGRTTGELAAGVAHLVDADALAPLAPMDDVRGTAAYRREAAARLIARGLAELGAELER
jgi:CO/xanthine dehydrogenase FAD-binding subunit